MHFHRLNRSHGIETVWLFVLNREVSRRKLFFTFDVRSLVGAYTINSDYALVISSVGIDDHGVYLCRAQNSEGFGLDSKPFHVETKGKALNHVLDSLGMHRCPIEPIQFSQKPNTMYEVHERDRLVVPCVAFGSPQPTIRWFKVRAQSSWPILILIISSRCIRIRMN